MRIWICLLNLVSQTKSKETCVIGYMILFPSTWYLLLLLVMIPFQPVDRSERKVFQMSRHFRRERSKRRRKSKQKRIGLSRGQPDLNRDSEFRPPRIAAEPTRIWGFPSSSSRSPDCRSRTGSPWRRFLRGWDRLWCWKLLWSFIILIGWQSNGIITLEFVDVGMCSGYSTVKNALNVNWVGLK